MQVGLNRKSVLLLFPGMNALHAGSDYLKGKFMENERAAQKGELLRLYGFVPQHKELADKIVEQGGNVPVLYRREELIKSHMESFAKAGEELKNSFDAAKAREADG